MTPSEREQRIEAAAKRRYESDDTGYQWEAARPDARVYYRKEASADLDAADEAVPVVPATWDGLLEHLDAMYPADVFSGESGDVGARLVVLARRLAETEAVAGVCAEPRPHNSYADPIDGGYAGYQAACWDCNWRGAIYLRGAEPMGTDASRVPKRRAQREAAEHSAANQVECCPTCGRVLT